MLHGKGLQAIADPFFVEQLLNPLSLRDIPLLEGMPEPAALRLQNPGAYAASMLRISLTLRHGG